MQLKKDFSHELQEALKLSYWSAFIWQPLQAQCAVMEQNFCLHAELRKEAARGRKHADTIS